MRALPVVGLVVVALPAASLALAWGRRLRRRRPEALPLLPVTSATPDVVDIAPFVARRALVDGALAVAALARRDTTARHSERASRSMPVPVIDLAAHRRARAALRPTDVAATHATEQHGIAVARPPRPGTGSFEHLA